YYPSEKREFEYARSFVEETDDVLEIGCGEGYFSKKLKCRSYTGLEINPESAEIARSRNINVVLESLEEHAQKKPCFYYLVCSFQVLEHVPDVRLFFESAISCTKPNGLIIFSVPDANSFVSMAPNVVLNMPPHHQTWWTESTFRQAASSLGLEFLE